MLNITEIELIEVTIIKHVIFFVGSIASHIFIQSKICFILSQILKHLFNFESKSNKFEKFGQPMSHWDFGSKSK